jgi:predicted transcriptional regulator
MPITRAARLMHKHTVKHMPVLDGGGGVVGMVSRSDLLKPFLRSDKDIFREITEVVLPRWLFIDPRKLVVSVVDGTVELSGEVERSSERDMLSHVIARLNGVVSVSNNVHFTFDDARIKLHALEHRLA